MLRRLSAYPLVAFAGVSAGFAARAVELRAPISYLTGAVLLAVCVALALVWSERVVAGRRRSRRAAAQRRLEEARLEYEAAIRAERATASAALAWHHSAHEIAAIEREYRRTEAEMVREAWHLAARRRALDQRMRKEEARVADQRRRAKIEMHRKRGAILRAAGDPLGAKTEYRRADELGDGAAAYELGMLLYESGDIKEAEAAWRRADERGYAAATSKLGDLLEQRGDSAGAETAWQRARAMRREGDDRAADTSLSEEPNGPAGIRDS